MLITPSLFALASGSIASNVANEIAGVNYLKTIGIILDLVSALYDFVPFALFDVVAILDLLCISR